MIRTCLLVLAIAACHHTKKPASAPLQASPSMQAPAAESPAGGAMAPAPGGADAPQASPPAEASPRRKSADPCEGGQ